MPFTSFNLSRFNSTFKRAMAALGYATDSAIRARVLQEAQGSAVWARFAPSVAGYPALPRVAGNLQIDEDAMFSALGLSGFDIQVGASSGFDVPLVYNATPPDQPALVDDGFTRSDFKVYLWPYNGSSVLQLDASGVSYYNGLGFGLTRDFYDVGGSGAIDQTALKTGATNSVDYWAARSEWASILLWWMDIETTYYTGATGDAHIVADIGTAVTGAKTQWATHHGTTMYVGSYSNSESGYGSDAAIGAAVAAELDFSVPELYFSNINSFKTAADNFCTMKSNRGITTPLIPIIWIDGRDSAFVSERLEYLIRKSQVNGVILWGTASAEAAPTYYDNYGWMQGAQDFITKYGLTIGTPF